MTSATIAVATTRAGCFNRIRKLGLFHVVFDNNSLTSASRKAHPAASGSCRSSHTAFQEAPKW